MGGTSSCPRRSGPFCARLEQLLSNQETLLPVDLPERVESLARKLAGHLLARAPAAAAEPDYAEVDVNSLQVTQPRSVGVDFRPLRLVQLGLASVLAGLEINAITRAMILAQIVGRMAHPVSELSTWNWLNDTSALGELLGLSLVAEGSLMRLVRAADVLIKLKAAIEACLFNRVKDLFSLETTVTLYNPTNTYLEGAAAANPKAKRGHSKEKRTDCPLVTLGLVLDGSGFVCRSEVFAGNAVEARTLEQMLDGLQAPQGALVVMDRGIAAAANRQSGCASTAKGHLVVNREAERRLPDGPVTVTTAGGDTLTVKKVVNEAAREVCLYCHSPQREAKERGIAERFCQRFEQGLAKLAEGLTRPRGGKRPDQIQERIGKLK
ncbi:MAG: IS1634 family transposase [Methylococcales bacterium]